jgi:hypothetical protein
MELENAEFEDSVGVQPRSPGLPYSATLGRRIALHPKPQRVVTLYPKDDEQQSCEYCVDMTGRNPFGMGINRPTVPPLYFVTAQRENNLEAFGPNERITHGTE